MATSAYWAWDRAGRPWKVAAPVKALGDRLKRYGYTVYFLGSDDVSHLQAARPLDHCPFSASGWPVAHPYPYVTALDIMPPPQGSGLPSLQLLGAQMIKDRNSGHPGIAWLKYINHEPERDWGGACWHHSWQPGYARTASTDRGHIHMSGRSDMVLEVGAAATYDPIARIRGESSAEEDDMATVPQPDWDNLDWLARSLRDGHSPIPGGPVKGAKLWLVEQIRALTAGQAASAQREQDLAVAVSALAAALAAGGGSVDAAAILARIDQRTADVTGRIAALDAELDAERSANADLRRRLAEALDGSG